MASSSSREVCILDTQFFTAPSSVISENTPRSKFRSYSEKDLISFGHEYEENLLQIIHTHLELDPHHLLVYVGPSRGNLPTEIEKRFCLLHPITILQPGGVTYQDITSSTRRLAIKLEGTGAEEYFSELCNDPSRMRKFDRILVDKSIQDMTDYQSLFNQMKRCLYKGGKAKTVLSDAEIPFMDIITSLQRSGCEVKWDLEHVPIRITKQKWIEMMRSRFPVELEIMSNPEIEDGIRELLTGQLNYLTNELEIEDRLIIVTGSLPEDPGKFTTVQRIIARPQQPYSSLLDLEYELTLTEPMKNILSNIANKKS